MMLQCWRRNPHHRPTFIQIVEQLLPDLSVHFATVSYYHSRSSDPSPDKTQTSGDPNATTSDTCADVSLSPYCPPDVLPSVADERLSLLTGRSSNAYTETSLSRLPDGSDDKTLTTRPSSPIKMNGLCNGQIARTNSPPAVCWRMLLDSSLTNRRLLILYNILFVCRADVLRLIRSTGH